MARSLSKKVLAGLCSAMILSSNIAMAGIYTPIFPPKDVNYHRNIENEVMDADYGVYTKNEDITVTTVLKGNAYIPKGTQMTIGLGKDLNSRDFRTGDLIPLKILHNVIIDDVIVIPAETPVYGRVYKSTSAGFAGRSGKIVFTINSIKTINGINVPLVYISGAEETSDPAPVTLAPITLLTSLLLQGGNAGFPEGQVFLTEVAVDVDLKVKRRDLAASMKESMYAVPEKMLNLHRNDDKVNK